MSAPPIPRTYIWYISEKILCNFDTFICCVDPIDKSEQLYNLQFGHLGYYGVPSNTRQIVRIPVLELSSDICQSRVRAADGDGVGVREGGDQHVDDRRGAGHHHLDHDDPGDRPLLQEEGRHETVRDCLRLVTQQVSHLRWTDVRQGLERRSCFGHSFFTLSKTCSGKGYLQK